MAKKCFRVGKFPENGANGLKTKIYQNFFQPVQCLKNQGFWDSSKNRECKNLQFLLFFYIDNICNIFYNKLLECIQNSDIGEGDGKKL